MSGPALAARMEGVSKRFGPVQALSRVDFELREGEIHALLGENGAGKSTLMHVLAGLVLPDAGLIEVAGQRRRFRSARDASAAGIGMVHQHFTLVENLTVAENLALADPGPAGAGPGLLLRGRGLAGGALEVAARLGWSFEPEAPVSQLPVGAQQRLEIVKALARDPRILIFDEPTAVLAPQEAEQLFEVLERLRAEGRSLVFISHKLNEVLRLCDRATVLRRGTSAGTLLVRETDASELARRMVGEEDGTAPPPARGRAPGPAVLRVRDLWVRDGRGLDAVRGVSLEVRAGEILGLAGVDGNGQTELAEAVAGLAPAHRGRIEGAGGQAGDGGGSGQGGRPAPPPRALPAAAARTRIGYIPQDRRRDGIIAWMSVRDNLVLELHARPEASWGPFLRWPWLTSRAEEMVRRFDIRAAGLHQRAGTLSGGNQQKLVIARALEGEPALLVAVNPTRGLDVGATAYVHAQLREQRERGAAVLLISTELDEVTALADRVGVLHRGELMGIVPPDTPRERLGLMMGGARVDPGDPGPEPAALPRDGGAGDGA